MITLALAVGGVGFPSIFLALRGRVVTGLGVRGCAFLADAAISGAAHGSASVSGATLEDAATSGATIEDEGC
jgi:hypothetical protein